MTDKFVADAVNAIWIEKLQSWYMKLRMGKTQEVIEDMEQFYEKKFAKKS